METRVLVRGRLVFVTLAIALLSATPSSRPMATIASDGHVEVRLPESVLRNEEVHKHLLSGLTTILLFTAGESRSSIEIRYDLWDEKFLISRIDPQGHREKISIDSYEHLVSWWSQTPLPAGTKRDNVLVKLEVIPFSAIEEKDAQRWLAHSIGANSNTADTPSDRSGETGSIVDLLIGTSIQRRPLQTWKWNVSVEHAK